MLLLPMVKIDGQMCSDSHDGDVHWNLIVIASCYTSVTLCLYGFTHFAPPCRYYTDTGRITGFRCRAVVGGLFSRLMLQEALAARASA